MAHGAPAVQRESIVALRDKYRTMLRMRREDAAGTVDDPRADMRALAARFPGALREIDELPLDAIESRVGLLERVLAGNEQPPAWARWFIAYHGWMRVALRIKQRCRGVSDDGAAHERALADYAPAADEPPAEALTRAVVAAITRPEAVRLNPFVFARVAEAHGVDAAEVRATLFK